MNALNRGYFVTTVLAMGGFAAAVYLLLRPVAGSTIVAHSGYLLGAGVVGILTAYAFVWITQYYTEYKYRPVQSIAEASRTGPATNIIAGLAVGMECTGMPVIVISVALMASYKLGQLALPDVAGAGLYGTAVATMGMLAPCAYILAMDTFGPITDNAGGIIEMSGQPEEIRAQDRPPRRRGQHDEGAHQGLRDRLGRPRRLPALPRLPRRGHEDHGPGHRVDLTRVPVFVGGLLGATLVFVFSSLAIKAVGKAAQSVITEVRRQFKENPGIMAGTSKPDYARCVDIVTKGALRAMVAAGPPRRPHAGGGRLLFKFLSPYGQIGAESVAGLLMVGTITGILMAMFMNNGGGAWDNAEEVHRVRQVQVDGVVVGKKSDPHKAAVVGDTVGDPFKDTAGPSLHVLIKLLSTITLVLAAAVYLTLVLGGATSHPPDPPLASPE